MNKRKKFYCSGIGSGYLPGRCFVCGTPVGGNHLARQLTACTVPKEDADTITTEMFDGKAQVLPSETEHRAYIQVWACDRHQLSLNHLGYHVFHADQSISREVVQQAMAAPEVRPVATEKHGESAAVKSIHEALEAAEGQWVGVLTPKNQRAFGRLSAHHPYGEERIAIFPVEGQPIYPYRNEVEELRLPEAPDEPRTFHAKSKESAEKGDLGWLEAEAETVAALGRLYFTGNTAWGEKALRVGRILARDMQRILTRPERGK